MTRLLDCLESFCKGLNTVKEKAECLLASNNKKMFFVPVLLLKYIIFFIFNSVFLLLLFWGFYFVFVSENMHCCFK